MVEVNGLNGGRRLLSDDIALLEAFALVVGKRVDAVRVVQERFDRGMREREITQLAAEAELRALRAQLNPHFLFNALTTIGYLLKTAPERALGTLYRLTDLLRAVLRRPPGEVITLGEELDLVESYLAIERERFEERLTTRIDVPDELRALPNAAPPRAAPGRERGQTRHLAAQAWRHCHHLGVARHDRRRATARRPCCGSLWPTLAPGSTA